jgi:GNAT superfamily N-acetyltransferase
VSGGLEIVEGYRPGAIGRIAEMHSRYYAREWGFGVYFEAKVARECADFFERADDATDRAWLVLDGERVVGSLIVDGAEGQGGGNHGGGNMDAHLRWFVLDDGLRGQGVGADLMARAVGFCDARGVRCYLTTFAGLEAARALYERHGFKLTDEKAAETWGKRVREQLFERGAVAAGTV